MDIEDIENLISSPNGYREHERLQHDLVIARVKQNNHLQNGTNKQFVNKKEFRRIKSLEKQATQLDEDADDEADESISNHQGDSISFKPGQATTKIYVKTWGCTHNDSDAQYMAGQLQAYGYTITNDAKQADLWLLNSCTVKSPAEQHFHNYVVDGLKSGKKVVVSGCVSQGQPNSKYLKGISIVGVQQIDRVVEVVEETLQGRTVRLLGVRKKENGKNKKKLTSLNLPKIRKNELIEIIPINVGCLNQCTYCKTKHARGELASYTIKEITDRALQSIKEGVKEIYITSEDTGAYGKDLEPDSDGIQPNIANLLKNVLNVMPSNCRLRLGMTNPPYVKEHIEEIAEIMKNDQRIYKFVHIPVQSGSNTVLEDMKREYTVEDFQYIVDVMKKRVPGITIATDLILGFPTETEEDFEQTVKLVERNKFPSLFINQFYPRPGTPAAKMELISGKEVKRRTKKMTEIFHSYYPYEKRVGQEYTVLVTEVSSDGNFYVGHNQFYEQVLVPKRNEYLGRLIDVRIKSVGKWFMVGEPLNEGRSSIQAKLYNLLNIVDLSSNTTKLTLSTIFLGCLTIYYFKLLKQ